MSVMFPYLILLFTILPAIELMILIEVGTRIGAWNTLFLIILTGVGGAALARYQGFSILRRIQEKLNQGEMPAENMFDGVLILIGGILLLTPGFVTDTLGFLLLIPWARSLMKNLLRKKFEQSIKSGTTMTFFSSSSHPQPQKKFEDADYYEN